MSRLKIRRSVVFHATPLKIPNINYRPVVVFTCLVCGLIIGSTCIKLGSEDVVQAIIDITDGIREESLSRGYFNLIFRSFGIATVYFLLTFVFGLCAAGIPFILLIPVIKGIYIGCFATVMNTVFGATGIGYCALIVFPGAALTTASLIYACSAGIKMSLEICSSLMKKSNPTESGLLKVYCAKYAVLMLITLIASITDAVLIKMFGSFFTFN